ARTTGGTMPVEAVALSADGTPGLSATLRDMAPAAAQDLLRAAAGGVSRYVQNLADRQRVTIVGDRSVIEQTELPPLGAFVLGNIASLFDLPADQTAVVRVAQIPPGTRLQLLVGAADSP
ncbi:MAG TPA: hypothetical protein VF171_00615, partial [Trueperaceae bacterium]